MANVRLHEPEKLTRYAFGELLGAERQAVEEHVGSCTPCQDFITFARGFNAALREGKPESIDPGEPCPDASVIVDLEAGELDSETARHVHAHILFCANCKQEFYALRGLRSPSWTKLVIDAVRGALECATLSGSAELLEPEYIGVRDAGQSYKRNRIEIEDTLVDADSGTTSQIRLAIEAEPNRDTAAIVLAVKPPQPEWRVSIFNMQEEELAGTPLSEGEITIASGLPYGRYTVKVSKGQETLASFVIELRQAEDS